MAKSKNVIAPNDEKALVVMEQMSKSIEEADRLYGDGYPFQQERVEIEIRAHLSNVGESLFEADKRLILLKEHIGHGEFMNALQRINISPTAAHYAMATATLFISNFQTFENLGKSKMQILTVFERNDIEKLAKGGVVAGMTLDDIERMSVRELQKTVRLGREEVKKLKEARRKDRDTFEKSLTAKDAKLNEYELREAGMEPPTKEKAAMNMAADARREIFGKLLIAAQYISEAESIAENMTRIPDITAEALTSIKEAMSEPYDALSNSYLALEDVWNSFFPEKAEDGYADS